MNERLNEVENMLGVGEDIEEGEVKQDLLSFLLKNTTWSTTQVVDNAVDLLSAGIDTVSYIAHWSMSVLHARAFT